jgi:hypothetical protein
MLYVRIVAAGSSLRVSKGVLFHALPDRPTPAGLPRWRPRGRATAPANIWISDLKTKLPS